jgi:site-specific DNA-adenine methylase
MGGKSLLAKTIIPKIPKHQCYAEVFAGAASFWSYQKVVNPSIIYCDWAKIRKIPSMMG